jgi:hypothetical protein
MTAPRQQQVTTALWACFTDALTRCTCGRAGGATYIAQVFFPVRADQTA